VETVSAARTPPKRPADLIREARAAIAAIGNAYVRRGKEIRLNEMIARLEMKARKP
jgi:hypothetical protein